MFVRRDLQSSRGLVPVCHTHLTDCIHLPTDMLNEQDTCVHIIVHYNTPLPLLFILKSQFCYYSHARSCVVDVDVSDASPSEVCRWLWDMISWEGGGTSSYFLAVCVWGGWGQSQVVAADRALLMPLLWGGALGEATEGGVGWSLRLSCRWWWMPVNKKNTIKFVWGGGEGYLDQTSQNHLSGKGVSLTQSSIHSVQT